MIFPHLIQQLRYFYTTKNELAHSTRSASFLCIPITTYHNIIVNQNRITVIHSTLCTNSTYVPLSTKQVTTLTCLRTPSFLELMFGQILVVISRLPKTIPFLGGRRDTMMREPVFQVFPWTKVSGKSCWSRRKQVTRQRRVMDGTSICLQRQTD